MEFSIDLAKFIAGAKRVAAQIDGPSASTLVPLAPQLNHGLRSEDLYLQPRDEAQQRKSVNTASAPGRNRVKGLEVKFKREPLPPAQIDDIGPNSALLAAPIDDTKARRKLDALKKKERLTEWFGLPQQKLTPEIVAELEAIRLRGFAKRDSFSKSSDWKKLPTHFHIAQVVDNQMSKGIGESTRVVPLRKRKAKSLLSEILADSEAQDWIRSKYNKIQESKTSGGKLWYKKKRRIRNPDE